jgi:hypothetical protein
MWELLPALDRQNPFIREKSLRFGEVASKLQGQCQAQCAPKEPQRLHINRQTLVQMNCQPLNHLTESIDEAPGMHSSQ